MDIVLPPLLLPISAAAALLLDPRRPPTRLLCRSIKLPRLLILALSVLSWLPIVSIRLLASTIPLLELLIFLIPRRAPTPAQLPPTLEITEGMDRPLPDENNLLSPANTPPSNPRSLVALCLSLDVIGKGDNFSTPIPFLQVVRPSPLLLFLTTLLIKLHLNVLRVASYSFVPRILRTLLIPPPYPVVHTPVSIRLNPLPRSPPLPSLLTSRRTRLVPHRF